MTMTTVIICSWHFVHTITGTSLLQTTATMPPSLILFKGIFCARITLVSLTNLEKISYTMAELLQVEDFQYGSFDLEL